MIQSQDLEQLPENLHLALLAVNYSLFNFDLYGFVSQCLYCPLYPLSPLFIFHLFLLRGYLQLSTLCLLLSYKIQVLFLNGVKNSQSVRKPAEKEGDSPARESFRIYFHTIFA